MNEVAFEELLLDARSSTAIKGLRKLILTAALRGEFDVPSERQLHLRNAMQEIKSPAFRGRVRKRTSEMKITDSSAVHSVDDSFVVNLGDIATIEKGKTGIKDAQPGEYPMVVTAEGRLSADHFDFEGPAVIIPLVSSTGHGDASLKRIHYQDGKYAVGSILCVVQSRYTDLVHPRYLYEYLAAFKDELLVSRMSGTANVSLTIGRVEEVPVPLITYGAQKKLERLMSLCDALEAKGQLEATQHAQLVSILLATLTQGETPAQLADNWHRIATHFDRLLDRPEAVDAMEQTLLQLAVRGLLVPQDPQDEPASELLKKIRAEKDKLIAEGKFKRDKPLPPMADDEQPFALPPGWEWVRLNDLIRIGSGDGLTAAQMAPGGTIPVYGGNGVNGHHDKANVDEPTLVIGRVGYYCGSVHITPTKAWVTDNAFITRYSKACLDMTWLYWLLVGTNLKENDSATAQPVISGRKLYPIVVALPPLVEQSRIVTRVAQLRRLCADLRQRLAASQSTQAHLAEALVENIA